MELAKKVDSFPNAPGIYRMKDLKGQVLYVGKAKNLRKRVASYLRPDKGERAQIRFLMSKTVDIDFIVTQNEKEALLLENTLIKKDHPRYNIQLRDDKSYASLKLSKDRFPRLTITRQIKKDGSLYFGPYASAGACRETLDFIERHFRLRTCADNEFANRTRPCLQYQIHRCDAPCVNRINEENYRRIVDQVKLFLQGRRQELIREMEEVMKEQSEREEFEKAAASRDLIHSLQETLQTQKVARHTWIDQDLIGIYREGERVTFCIVLVRQGKVWETRLIHLAGHEEDADLLTSFLSQFYEGHPLPDEILLPFSPANQDLLEEIFSEKRGQKTVLLVPQRGDRRDLLELALRNAREGFLRREKKGLEMAEILNRLQQRLHLQNFPKRIECFDISNTAWRQAVGSLVSFADGESDKSGYRKFKIKTVEGPNDFSMMREVLRRRLTRIGSPDKKWERPDLILLDGGKGQLSAVLAIVAELNITGIDIAALAKEREGETQDKVFLPGRKNPVLLGRHSSLLHLLMRVRDEAHRFAITYHRKLRAREFIKNA